MKNFTATIHNVTFDQPALFEQAVKQEKAQRTPLYKRTVDGTKQLWQTGVGPIHVKAQPLGKTEKEWLGAWVAFEDGAIGQVWSLAHLRGCVHVVTGGMSGNILHEDVPTSALTTLGDASTDIDALIDDAGESYESLLYEMEYACGACGEREGSSYAKRCCTSDNMIAL